MERADRRGRSRTFRGVLVPGFFGLLAVAFVSAFVLGKQYRAASSSPPRIPDAMLVHKADRLSFPRDQLADRLDPARSNRRVKGSFADEAGLNASVSEAEAALDAEMSLAGPDVGQSLPRVLPAGLSLDPRTGLLAIASFAPLKFAGAASSCREIGEAMVADVPGSDQALHIVAESDLISLVRICAGNGSVVLSCRGGDVTISPRRPRPNDGCAGSRA